MARAIVFLRSADASKARAMCRSDASSLNTADLPGQASFAWLLQVLCSFWNWSGASSIWGPSVAVPLSCLLHVLKWLNPTYQLFALCFWPAVDVIAAWLRAPIKLPTAESRHHTIVATGFGEAPFCHGRPSSSSTAFVRGSKTADLSYQCDYSEITGTKDGEGYLHN